VWCFAIGLAIASGGMMLVLQGHFPGQKGISEHGRTPQLQNVKGGGRDHWSRAYAAIFAGGGFAAERVVGKTDRIAGDVMGTPVSPKDILATTYHLLGIDPATLLSDRLGRPLPVAGEGKVRGELLG